MSLTFKRSSWHSMVLLAASAWLLPAYAEDIDIFTKNTSTTTASKPNVMLLIDNGADWSSRYTVTGTPTKQAAVSDAIAAVANNSELVDKVRLGMMLFTAKNTPEGGKLLAGVSNFSTARQSVFQCLVYGYVPPVADRTETTTTYETVTTSRYALPRKVGKQYKCDGNTGSETVASTYVASATTNCEYITTTTIPHTTTVTIPGTPGGCLKSAGYALEKSNNSPVAKSFHEAYRYFRAANSLAGQVDGLMSSTWENSPGTIYSSSSNNYGSVSNPQLGADPKVFASGTTRYISPAQANTCAGNFIVLIGTVNGNIPNQEDGPAKALLWKDQSGAEPGTSGWVNTGAEPESIVLSSNRLGHNYADEYARFLSRADVDPAIEGNQSVITYVIDVYDPAAKADLDTRAFYKSVATQGKGRYFSASNASEVAAALTEILNEVQAVNTSFASASMPISMTAENQGTNENQVYIGMFRPDAQARPRWVGNLKPYKYLFSNGAPYLADQNGQPAYNPVTGFLQDDTVSFWTGKSTYWQGMADYDNPSDSPDGPLVEKGAAAQKLRARTSADPRTLLTCDASCSNGSSLQTLTLSNANLQKWFSGYDVQNETGRSDATEMRPSIHGDVLHSRPLVVNYGSRIVVYYGANDGSFRAVEGGLTGSGVGKELWAMTFSEHTSQLEALYNNLAKVGDTAVKHPYFMDGSTTLYKETSKDATSGNRTITKAWIYLPMRRGGNFIYALDVTDPDAPKFKWKVKGGGADSFSTLGQTWSSPKMALVRAHTDADGNPKPVVFFGGGYDAGAEDYVAGSGTRPARTSGKGIYMVDADTGQFLWYGETSEFSIPGDLTLVNYSRDAAGYADRIYFADTGGNVWRADISATSASNYRITKLFSLGGSCSTTSSADCRKFLYNPSVVVEPEGYVSLLIGSGDREHPFDTSVENRFYLLKDRGQTTAITESGMQELTGSTASTSIVASKIYYGWYFKLEAGEKVVGNALTQGGETYFNTNKRVGSGSQSCNGDLGIARKYGFSYKNPLSVITFLADEQWDEVAGGGLLPPPVPMTLCIEYNADGTCKKYWSGVGSLDPEPLGNVQPGARQKTFWFRQVDD